MPLPTPATVTTSRDRHRIALQLKLHLSQERLAAAELKIISDFFGCTPRRETEPSQSSRPSRPRSGLFRGMRATKNTRGIAPGPHHRPHPTPHPNAARRHPIP
mmetsp:Transcript_4263/g.11035  ORF Transcript_4263/g.11035 Transcript_4263/m.11035 type:complete len:103 (-) Transcript_4263:249-557(-)